MTRAFSVRAYGILVEGTQVLLTRSRFQGREFVNFPGGGVELGEAPLKALEREFQEETGLAIRPVRILHASEAAHLSTWKPWQIVGLYWLVETTGGALKAGGNGDDVASLFWAEKDAIPTAEMFQADVEFALKLPGLL